MDDKVFNLLEKMYIEFTSFKQDMIEFKRDMNEFKQDITQRVSKIEVILENQINPQIMLLSEGQLSNNEKLDLLSEKVDLHDVKIQVIEGGKKS